MMGEQREKNRSGNNEYNKTSVETNRCWLVLLTNSLR